MRLDCGLLANEDVEAFERDGAVCLRAVISSDTLTLLRSGLERNLREACSPSL